MQKLQDASKSNWGQKIENYYKLNEMANFTNKNIKIQPSLIRRKYLDDKVQYLGFRLHGRSIL